LARRLLRYLKKGGRKKALKTNSGLRKKKKVTNIAAT